MKDDGFVDGNITNDIDKAFGGLTPGENYHVKCKLCIRYFK
jgi:hypothetical protein